MIKKIVYLITAAVLVTTVSCKKDDSKADTRQSPFENRNESAKPTPPADGKYPTMVFEEPEHDFGQINQGDKVEYVFKFKNTGEADLIISDAKGSCGCTIPEYTKDPIKPGEAGEMKVSFNSAHKTGIQKKSVNITTNTVSGYEKLVIRASIKEPAGSGIANTTKN